MEYGVFTAVAKPWTVLDLEISGGRWQRKKKKKKIDTPESGEEEQSEASTYEKYAMTILFYYFFVLIIYGLPSFPRSSLDQTITSTSLSSTHSHHPMNYFSSYRRPSCRHGGQCSTPYPSPSRKGLHPWSVGPKTRRTRCGC